MKGILLMSVIIVTFVVPTLAARRRNPARAVRGFIGFMFLFTAMYWAYVAYVHTSRFVPHR
jgi:uncharacterized membrane protein